MKISNENYIAAHGRRPNGREPALWAFGLYRDGVRVTIHTPGPMKLTAAKRFAVQVARQIGGIEHIEVAP